MPPAVIALLTDFGARDAYVGTMKGVILSRAPHARLVDLTHDVPPQSVGEAAFLLAAAYPYFPRSSIFLTVVDPGVGTTRRRIALVSGDYVFVGPDNGCLSAALPDDLRGQRSDDEGYLARPVTLPPDIVAVTIENATLFQRPVSATFEGRDVFAPSAGYLANGGLLIDLGPRVDQIEALPCFRAPAGGSGRLGRVIHIDAFGNLVTDIRANDIADHWAFEAAGRRLELAATYTGTQGPIAIRGSSGYVELSVANGNAAIELGLGVGDVVGGYA